jgi:hypothetical protein
MGALSTIINAGTKEITNPVGRKIFGKSMLVGGGATGTALAFDAIPNVSLDSATSPETPSVTETPASPLPKGEPIPQAETPAVPAEPAFKMPTIKPKKVGEFEAPSFQSIEETMKGLQGIKDKIAPVDPDGKLAKANAALEDNWNSAKTVYEMAISGARSDAEKEKASLEWQQVATMFSEALVNIGAGIVGLKTGQDLSGVKFNKRDWEAEYERLRKGTQDKIADAATKLGISQEDFATKKKEIAAQMEMQQKDREHELGMQQEVYLKDVANKDKTAMDVAKTNYESKVMGAKLDFEAQVTNASNALRQYLGEENVAAKKEALAAKVEAAQAKGDLKAVEKANKEAAALDKLYQEAGALAISARNLPEGTAKAALKRQFIVGLKRSKGLADTEAEEIWDKMSQPSGIVNLVTGRQDKGQAAYEALGTQPAPASGGQQTMASGIIRMKLPDGRVVPVKSENVERAKSLGAIEVQ